MTSSALSNEAEDFASRHYEDLPNHRSGAEKGFIAGRTVSVEQIRLAGERIFSTERLFHTGITQPRMFTWDQIGHEAQDRYCKIAHSAFVAAGFRVEGES